MYSAVSIVSLISLFFSGKLFSSGDIKTRALIGKAKQKTKRKNKAKQKERAKAKLTILTVEKQ